MYRCPRCRAIHKAGDTAFIDCACGARWCTHCHPEYEWDEAMAREIKAATP